MRVERVVVGGCHLNGHLPGYPWRTTLLLAHKAGAPGVIWGRAQVVALGVPLGLPPAHQDGALALYSYYWHTMPVRQGKSGLGPTLNELLA
jgi:hypothetical protein